MKNIKKTITLLLLLILIVLLILLLIHKNTVASYLSNITGKSITKIASPVFVMETTDKKLLNDDNTEIDYLFNIKNFNENGERNQANLKYYIEISPKLDSTITLTLYKDNVIVPLNNQKTDYIDLSVEDNIIHEYRLNLKYEREKSNSTTDIKESIFIKSCAVQK